jgi:hypothetical protein
MIWAHISLGMHIIVLGLFFYNGMHCARTDIWEFICLPKTCATRVTFTVFGIMLVSTCLQTFKAVSPVVTSDLFTAAFGLYLAFSIYFRESKYRANRRKESQQHPGEAVETTHASQG